MVITFVTSPDLQQCARNLDRQRLGKQRVEAMQLIDTLEGRSNGWSSHPAAKMWEGYVDALKIYFNYIVREWISRGYVNNLPYYPVDEREVSFIPVYFDGVTTTFGVPSTAKTFPWWFLYPPVIYSHMAALVRKNPDHYLPLFKDQFPGEYIKYGYIWPSHVTANHLQHFTFEICDPIGAGAPAQFRISLDEIKLWIQNPNKNPKTGRQIKNGSNIYNDNMKAYEYYKSIGMI